MFSCDCGREWGGLAECHCTTCHLQFRSVSGFDMHRIGAWTNRRCLSPKEMLKRGMAASPGMHGDLWVTEKASVTPGGRRSASKQGKVAQHLIPAVLGAS